MRGGKKLLFCSSPRFPEPSRRFVPSLWFLFPPSTAPPYIRCRVPVPTVSFSVVCPVVPEPSRRSHTVSPTSVLLGKLFSISFLSGFLGFPSYYDHGFATGVYNFNFGGNRVDGGVYLRTLVGLGVYYTHLD